MIYTRRNFAFIKPYWILCASYATALKVVNETSLQVYRVQYQSPTLASKVMLGGPRLCTYLHLLSFVSKKKCKKQMPYERCRRLQDWVK